MNAVSVYLIIIFYEITDILRIHVGHVGGEADKNDWQEPAWVSSKEYEKNCKGYKLNFHSHILSLQLLFKTCKVSK